MRMRCSYLSEAEKERIHRDSLKILWEVGIKFMQRQGAPNPGPQWRQGG